MARIRFLLAFSCVVGAGLWLTAPARAAEDRLPVEIGARGSHGLALIAATATPEGSQVAVAIVVSRTLLTGMPDLERLRVALLDAEGKLRSAHEVWLTPARAGRHDARAHRVRTQLPLRANAGDRVVVGWIDDFGLLGSNRSRTRS